MATSLKAKLLTAASADAGLRALVGMPMRWFDQQLKQGSALPAVVVQQISNPRTYSFTERLSTSFSRMQFTIWGRSSEESEAVVNALANFLDTFNPAGLPGNLLSYPNFIVGDRDGFLAAPAPPKYTRLIDVQIFDNERVA